MAAIIIGDARRPKKGADPECHAVDMCFKLWHDWFQKPSAYPNKAKGSFAVRALRAPHLPK
jgi:hypothetical protein